MIRVNALVDSHKSMSKSLKIIGDNIILKATKKSKGIIVMQNNVPTNRRQWVLENGEIYDFGPDVKGYKKGQAIIMDPNMPIKIIPLDKILGEEKTDDGKAQDEIAYIAVKEENIIAVIK